MPFIVDISTVVPEYKVSNEDFVRFYSRSIGKPSDDMVSKKLNYLIHKSSIQNRHSCISDFNGESFELFDKMNFNPGVEKRMAVYKNKVVDLSIKTIAELLNKTKVNSGSITHLITVSCTGIFAPGLEFSIASALDLEHTEKSGLYFIGCHAALKALKQAYYISKSDPAACVVILCVELSSLHFVPSLKDDDLLANLLFADGAAAVMVCGEENEMSDNQNLLSIDAFESSCIANTTELMTWNITGNAFRMVLNKNIANVINDNLFSAVNGFDDLSIGDIDYYAIHPGGARIVEAVKNSLNLNEEQVFGSLNVLKRYGNMSSPTILFIIKDILNKLKKEKLTSEKSVFACAFGPGIIVEMMLFSWTNKSLDTLIEKKADGYAVQI